MRYKIVAPSISVLLSIELYLLFERILFEENKKRLTMTVDELPNKVVKYIESIGARVITDRQYSLERIEKIKEEIIQGLKDFNEEERKIREEYGLK